MICRPANTPPQRYLLGNALTVTVILTDTDGNVVDPANLRMLIKGPSDIASTLVTMTVDGDKAIGVFTPDEVGRWNYRVETFSGPVNAAIERLVIITDRAVPGL